MKKFIILTVSLLATTVLCFGQVPKKPLSGKTFFIENIDCVNYDLSLLYDVIDSLAGAKPASARVASEKFSLILNEKGRSYELSVVSQYGTIKVGGAIGRYSVIGKIETVLTDDRPVCEEIARAMIALVK